jgi:hypothetical protein
MLDAALEGFEPAKAEKHGAGRNCRNDGQYSTSAETGQ